MNVLDELYSHRDNASDRELGKKWERHFCELATSYKKSFTPHQIGRDVAATWYAPTANGINPLLLPDATVWTAPGEHHEIKHKEPTRSGCYGLEQYRLKALWDFRRETEQRVFYTIHDWRLAGVSDSHDPMPNLIEHWRTVDIEILVDYVRTKQTSKCSWNTYVNAQWEIRPGYFWPVALWQPLECLWIAGF